MTELSNKLITYVEKLPKQVAINLLLAALDEMQSYNGQSQTSAVARALDAKEIAGGANGTRWKLPSIAETKKRFS
jgi:hypothetical protein